MDKEKKKDYGSYQKEMRKSQVKLLEVKNGITET